MNNKTMNKNTTDLLKIIILSNLRDYKSNKNY